jgi:hypothetical protein
MGQSRKDATLKDAQNKLDKEGCASDMGQRSKFAAVEAVQKGLRMKECV